MPLSQNAQNVGASIGTAVNTPIPGTEADPHAMDKLKKTAPYQFASEFVAPVAKDVANIVPAAAIGKNLAGAAGDAIGESTANAVAKSETGNPVSDDILHRGRQEGLVVPPATLKTSSTASKMLEGFGGKQNVGQEASIRNQVVFNRLARKALGLPEDSPLNLDTLEESRANAGQSYAKVAAAGPIKIDPQYHEDLNSLNPVSSKILQSFPNYKSGSSAAIQDLSNSLRPEGDVMDASVAVEMSKDLRKNSNANEALAFRSADPNAKALASAQRDAAESIEDQVKRHLDSIGQGDLANEWDAARTHIAKTYTVQKALDGAGNVDATKLGRALKNKNYNDELQLAGDFANAFPKVSRVAPGKESMPGISPLDVYGSVAASLGTGNMAPMLLGPGRILARKAVLSDTFQAKPKSPEAAPK